MYPIARRADLIIEQVGPDTLVYDQLRDEAHSLNPVTGYVFRNADGTRSVERLSTDLSIELGRIDDPDVVLAAITELDRVNLLDEADFSGAGADGVSRREAMIRVGVATLAIVAISSISVPTPAMAKSWGYMKPPQTPRPGKPQPSIKQVKSRIADAVKRILSRFGR